MSAEIIKEFLVGLGFKVDAGGLKRFTQGIDAATKVAVKAGAAASGMAVAVEAAVVKVSRQFEDLYYASQRINSSVENIRAMDYAVTQMGGSAQGARAAMEGVASLIRSNPGGENFIRSLGVETRAANGELRDTAEIIRDLGDRFRGMPYYMAKVRAGVLGIDEMTLQALIRGTDDFADRYGAMARQVGVDQEAAAQASHDFMVAVRDLMVQLELLAGKFLLTFQNSGMLERLVANLGPVFMALGRLAQRVGEWFGEADEATGGWSTALVVLFGILAPIVALLGPAVAGVMALAAAIVALIDDFQTWREGGKSLIDWATWSAEIDNILKALKPLFKALGELVSALAAIGEAIWKYVGPAVTNIAHATLESIAGGIRMVTGVVRILTSLLRGEWAQAWDRAKEGAVQWAEDVGRVFGKLFGAREAPGQPGRPTAKLAPGPAPWQQGGELGQQITAFFQRKGFSAAQSQGIAAGMWAENAGFNPSAVNPTSGAYGIGQWLGPRKAELFRRYGRRPTLNQQLEFLAWELNGGDHGGAAVRGATTAHGALDAYIRKFMRPAAGAETSGDLARGAQYLAGQMRRPVLATSAGAQGVQITQKTDIHVTGSSDPQATGRMVASEQGRVNGDLVRNTRGAIQ